MTWLLFRGAGHAKQKGFTLIELLVVISIIALLMSVLITDLRSARKKANDARRLTDANSIVIALQLAREKYGRYPCSAGELSSYPSFMQSLVNDGLLSSNPKDPINSGPYVYFYATYNNGSGDGCGSTFQLNYDIESRGTSCLYGGALFPAGDPDAIHCHLFFPVPLPCSDPYLSSEDPIAPDCAPYLDT